MQKAYSKVLPKTLVGKVAYRILEEEEAAKRGDIEDDVESPAAEQEAEEEKETATVS